MKRKMRRFAEGGYEEAPPDFEAPKKKKLSEMTDEERYGKVGAEIRRLDPEAFKNRTDKSAAANMELLKKLRAKKATPEPEPETETKSESDTDTSPRRANLSPRMSNSPTSSPKFRGPDRKIYDMDTLRDKYKEKTASGRGIAERVADFVRNTRMVGGAPDYMKDESGRIRVPSREEGMRRGGKVKKYSGGGSASKRADGIAQRGKTRGKMV